jgi:hypothetical protein
VVSNLAAIHAVLMKPQDAVNEGLMGRVKVAQEQRLGPDGNPKTEVVFSCLLKLFKGKSEITPPSHS